MNRPQLYISNYRFVPEELKARLVIAAGFLESEEATLPEHDALTEDGVLELAQPCRFCDYAGLCGIDFPEAQA